MRLRIPLSVAVVGALLLGGAATGTTRATWTDSVDLAASAMSSGSMGLTAAASDGSLSVPRGGSGTVMVTVNDTSSAAAKNLRQRVTATVGESLPTGITATLTTVDAGRCTGTPQGPVDLTPGGSLTTCVTVAATSGTSAASATVTVGVSGAQVRGGTVAGWTTPTQTVTVPVTVQGFGAPVLVCSPGPQGNGSYEFSWAGLPDATSYWIRAATADSGYQLVGVRGASTTSFTLTLEQNETVLVHVVALSSSWQLGTSNVLRIRRNGNSSNFSCEDLG